MIEEKKIVTRVKLEPRRLWEKNQRKNSDDIFWTQLLCLNGLEKQANEDFFMLKNIYSNFCDREKLGQQSSKNNGNRE